MHGDNLQHHQFDPHQRLLIARQFFSGFVLILD
jgi:hypothetical protein